MKLKHGFLVAGSIITAGGFYWGLKVYDAQHATAGNTVWALVAGLGVLCFLAGLFVRK